MDHKGGRRLLPMHFGAVGALVFLDMVRNHPKYRTSPHHYSPRTVLHRCGLLGGHHGRGDKQDLPMDTELAWSPNPKMPGASDTSFTANGKVYHRAEGISFNRHKWLSKMQVELGYGQSVEEFFAGQQEQYDLLNRQKFADAAVSIHNSMKGIASIADDRAPTAMKMTMLFWNYKGEDVRTMTDELMAEKLSDMEIEGISSGFFFDQAFSCVPGLLGAYRSLNGASTGTSSNDSNQVKNQNTESSG